MSVSTKAMMTSATSLALAVVLTGCRSDQPPQTGYQQPPPYGYGAPNPGTVPAPTGYPTAAPGTPATPGTAPAPTAYPTAAPGTPATPAPAPTANPTAAPGTPGTAPASTSCQAMDATAAAAVQPLLTALASSAVPAGAKPVGSVLACNFQQGQTLQGSVQMQPGKCYTVVGAGVPTVTQLDLQLVAQTPIPGMAPVLAQSNTTGSQAVIGKNPDCYKWGWPMGASVNVVVKATGGSGYAAAQVYEK